MANQIIGLGTVENDGTGDNLRVALDKVNDNFLEIYTLIGDASSLTSGISATATVVTLTAPTISGVVGGTITSATIATLTGTTFNAGTLALSAGSITDSSGAISFGNENLTTTGVVTAASLDISGNVDVDGTLETDALTIDGVSLSETIADTVGAMVSSNTETNITVTYDDADNTLDFVIGTLNQSTSGNAGTATALETARTIHGVSFDGTANIDLSEVVQDTVGAMFSNNTETNITATYQDADGTIDLVIGTLNQDTTGNAATATSLETARTIGGVSFDGSANINLPGVNSVGNQNTTGSAATLTTARTIGGTLFDGSANIDVALATLATTVTITNNESTDENNAIIFTAGGDIDGGNLGLESDGTLTYNPSTGKITATGFVGTLTGNVTGNTSGTAATVTGAAQTNITSVGTLTALQVDNINIDGNAITSTAGVDLTITPLAGQQIVLDGTIVIDAGVVTGATSITSTDFVGDITGDVTGNVSGSSGSTTGNAATATALATARTIGGVSFDGSANINLPGVNSAGNQDTSGTAALATTVTVTDSIANTNFPVVFHNESDALLDDTGALRYNPSTGTLLVPNLVVAGTTTQVDTVTMNAANAVVFEGATADAYETTLTITDPTADRTITLPDTTGTVALTSSNITGSAATLTTARTIGGVSFDGSANIDLPGVNSAGNQNTSGSAATVTGAAQTNITSVGTLTALQVDNININGNAITSTAGVDLTISPLAGQQIVLDGTIVVDAGVVTGATSITSTAFVGDITGDVTGNADTATVLATARTIGGVSFDGSANINLPGVNSAGNQDTSGTAATVTGAAQTNITSLGTLTALTVDSIIVDGTNIGHTSDTDAIAIAANGVVTFSQIPVLPANSIDSDYYVDGSIDTAHIADNQITLAKMAGIARGKIIYGDASGDPAVLTAGSNGQVLTSDGTDISWTDGAGVVAADDITAGDAAILLTTSSGNITIDAAADDSDIILKGTDGTVDTTYLTIDGSAAGAATFNSTVTATTFVGDVTGDVTGNADTATVLATARTIGGVSFNGSANINLPGVNSAGNQNTSGSAATLTTARTIGGTSFDGSANIDVALATLATTVTITDNESTDENNAIIFTAGGEIDGGNLGLESDGTLTYNPSTGKVTATGFVGTLTGNVTGNTSGTAATVTGAAQTNITSVGTLTALQVDNINIDGNAITSTAGVDLTITPLAGQQIVLDGAIVIDAGVVTGATSITSTDFVGDITGDVTGNADTATTLATARTIGGVSFDGSANINLPGVNSAGNQNTSGSAATLTTARTIGGTSFDGSANIDVALATLATTATVSDSTANTNFPVVFHNESNALLDDTGALRYNPSTGTLLVPNLVVAGTTTTVDTVTMEAANAIIFEGATADIHETTLTITDPTADRTITLPDATGTVALTSSNITGSAATLTTARTIGGVSFDGSANINLPGVNSAGNQNTTGSAATLTTARTIGGVSFDGSANINLPGVNSAGNQNTTGSAATLTTARTIGGTSFDGSANIDVALATLATTVTITDNESTNENNALIFTAGGDINGGNLGLESDGTLTYNPSTGKITATGFVGTLTGNVTGDVTGNADTATVLATARTIGGVSFDGSANINLPGVNSAGNQNTSGTAATVTGAAQTNITSVGTLTALQVDNININGNAITSTAGVDLTITPLAGQQIVLDGYDCY
jgi:hypothetical protein